MPDQLESLYGDTPVATLQIVLRRSGLMSVAGSINDEAFALYMLETAKSTVKEHHRSQHAGTRPMLLVPGYDTAITGTPEEKKLLAAKEELITAHEDLR